jgi:hypothetical protein
MSSTEQAPLQGRDSPVWQTLGTAGILLAAEVAGLLGDAEEAA